jgi:hypothetical protein
LTLIAALRESDTGVLIAADSGESETPGDLHSLQLYKLRQHPRAPLAWGAAGSGQIGHVEFTRWLEGIERLPATWDRFQDRAAERLAQLNGRRRELARLACAPGAEGDTATVLIVGWLDRPEIVELDDSGGATAYWDRGFMAIGSGKPHALIAYRTLSLVPDAQLPPLQRLRWIMDVAAGMVRDCAPPVHVWRITRDGITNALDGER